MIGQNTLIGTHNPDLPLKFAVLADLTEESPSNYFPWFIKEKNPELYDICRCESSFRPTICSYVGCYSGMGLCGFIQSTWNETLDRMNCEGKFDTDYCVKTSVPLKCNIKIASIKGFEDDKSHPVFDPECNVFLADWLYNADGSRHWNSSKKCWGSK